MDQDFRQKIQELTSKDRGLMVKAIRHYGGIGKEDYPQSMLQSTECIYADEDHKTTNTIGSHTVQETLLNRTIATEGSRKALEVLTPNFAKEKPDSLFFRDQYVSPVLTSQAGLFYLLCPECDQIEFSFEDKLLHDNQASLDHYELQQIYTRTLLKNAYDTLLTAYRQPFKASRQGLLTTVDEWPDYLATTAPFKEGVAQLELAARLESYEMFVVYDSIDDDSCLLLDMACQSLVTPPFLASKATGFTLNEDAVQISVNIFPGGNRSRILILTHNEEYAKKAQAMFQELTPYLRWTYALYYPFAGSLSAFFLSPRKSSLVRDSDLNALIEYGFKSDAMMNPSEWINLQLKTLEHARSLLHKLVANHSAGKIVDQDS